jgi:glycosyltransferase involved in cell wall biosynthesis
VSYQPLVSIVTIVYNGEKHLEQTIRSVLNQTYPKIEYIIIDGGSTDRSPDIIRKYNKSLAYWVSEKDNGVSDAFNKGIAKSTGDIIGLINSDDWYEETTVENVVKSIEDHDVVY